MNQSLKMDSVESSDPKLIYDNINNDDEFRLDLIDQCKNKEETSVSMFENTSEPIIMEIAEREHRKWLNPDVKLIHNPYTIESIEQRTKQLLEQQQSSIEDASIERDGNGSEDEDEDDGFEKKKFFSDRDITRYKRDYYLPKNKSVPDDSQVFSILNVSNFYLKF